MQKSPLLTCPLYKALQFVKRGLKFGWIFHKVIIEHSAAALNHEPELATIHVSDGREVILTKQFTWSWNTLTIQLRY